MKSLTRKIIFIVLIVASSESVAGYWVEPFYNLHRFGSININNGLDRKGGSWGGRLGYNLFSGINIGVDFRIGKIVMDRITGGYSELDSKYSSLYLSYIKMEWFDFWGNWLFSVSEEYNDSGQTLKGDGFALGIGLKLFPYFRINLEFSRYTFKEFEDASGNTSSTSSTFNVEELTGNDFLFGVSFPIPI